MPEQSLAIDAGALLTGLGGGLALFLFGMRLMTEALKVVAGASMKNLLARLTSNRFYAMLAGTLITAVIQSSSVTTVLVVGFVTAGIMNLSQSIGVIIGANIGTTITGQIIAFNIAKYGLAIVAVGFFVQVLARQEKYRQIGSAIMGLGLVFFGMELMTGATVPLRNWSPFIQIMQELDRPLIGVIVGTIFTAVIQSSSASTGIVIVLASQGMVAAEPAIALILGANLGTCVTAVISAIGSPREAIQVAVVHVLFNLIGVLGWFFLIPELASIVQSISPLDTARQIANAQTLLNVSNALVCIWLTVPMAQFARWLIPSLPDKETRGAPKFLDPYYLDQPALAVDRARMELSRQGEMIQQMLDHVVDSITGGRQADLERLKGDNADVDELQGAIVTWLGKLSQQNLTDPQPKRIQDAIEIANCLENMGDVIENNLVESAEKAIRRGAKASLETVTVIRPVQEKVLEAFQMAMDGLRNNNLTAAQAASDSKSGVNRLANRATSHLMSRLVAAAPNRLAVFRFETDIIEGLKRLNTLTRRIARIVLESHGGVASDVLKPVRRQS